MADSHEKEPWHLDKRVNVSVIAAIAIQVILFGMAWGNIENRVAQLEKRSDALNQVPEKLASIEATLIAIKERLDREAK